MAKFGFDPGEYKDPENNFQPIPAGRYFIKGTKADDKDTQSGGSMVAATFEVTRGERAKRKIFVNFNTVNKSDEAQKIGREQLSNWARACGKPKAMDTDLLLEIEVQADVGIQPSQNGYGPSNRIFKFYDKNYVDPAPGSGQASAPSGETTSASSGEPAGEKTINDPAKQGPAKQTAAVSGKKSNPWDD